MPDRIGDPSLMMTLYRRLASNPAIIETHIQIGVLLARQGHLDMSVPHFAVVATTREHELAPLARLELVRVHRGRNAPDLALTNLLPILERVEEAWAELSALLENLNRRRQFDRVESYARTIVKNRPRHRKTWQIVGDALLAGPKRHLVISYWARAVKLFPVDLAFSQKLTHCLRVVGRTDDALSEARRILDLVPENDVAWRAVSELALGKRLWTLAFDAACRAAALNPNVPRGHNLRLESMLNLRRVESIEPAAHTWLAFAPDHPRAHLQLASVMHSLGRVVAAEPHWQRGLELAEARARRAVGAWAGRRILDNARPSSRMGELAKVLDIFVKSTVLGWHQPFRGIVAGQVIARTNTAFLDYWREHVEIITEGSKLADLHLDPELVVFPTQCVRIGDGRVLQNDRAYHAVNLAWQQRGHGPVLKLKAEHRDHGLRELGVRGMPPEAWFVVLHVREDGFHNLHYKNVRSCQPASYIPMIERIAAHGGWVCRIGDPSMSPLPPLPNLIDVTSLDPRDSILDVFLVAAARFMVATSSGPLAMAICFGTPQVLTNVFPINERAWCEHDRFMPKIYWDLTSGRMIPFQRALNELAPIGRTTDNFGILQDHNLAVIDNTAEEIVDAVEEMLALTAGDNPEDAATVALQDRYDAYCRAELPIFSSRIAGSFIRRYADLL